MEYQFCFDLHFDKVFGLYLPVSYIVTEPEPIEYLDKRASDDVLQNLGIVVDDLDADLKKALKICKTLQLPSILKKFSTKKKFKSCEELIADASMQKGVFQFIHFQLDNFLELAFKLDFPLSIDLDIEKHFAKNRIEIAKTNLEAKLHFEKTESILNYSLFLHDNNQIIAPMDAAIIEVREKSKWIVFNKKLVQLKGIDSKNLKPFFKNRTLEIAKQNIPMYFENFIKNTIKKVEIEAKGFETIQKDSIRSGLLTIEEDFFSSNFALGLAFDYEGAIFAFEKPKNSHSTLDFSDYNNIKLNYFKRNESQEAHWINTLENLGLKRSKLNFFEIASKENDRFQTLQWAIENKSKLIQAGFHFSEFKIKGKIVNTEMAVFTTQSTLHKDWFDLEIQIQCGEILFNFQEIIGHIKERNRLFLLENDTYFLIPLEWFTDFSTLVKMVHIEKKQLRLPKSNYSLIESIGSDAMSQNLVKEKTNFVISSHFKAQLRPYQLEGAQWLWNHYKMGLGACLADDMGLGKTLQTLALLATVKENEAFHSDEIQLDLFENPVSNTSSFLKTLLILPSSLVFNWYNEAKKFTPHFKILRYIGADRKEHSKKLDRYDLILTTYSVAIRDSSVFEKYHFTYLILDESQYVKNKNSASFKKINQFQADNKISISGTPIENSLSDLWSQMQLINPNLLGSYDFFVKNFKYPIEKKQDEVALTELKTLIKPFVLRRTKEQVLHDLPEKVEQYIYCEMESEQEKWYEEEKSKARNFLLSSADKKTDRISIINTLMRLRQLSNHPKMRDADSDLDSGKYIAVTNYLSTLVQSRHKTIVFSSFVTNLGFYEDWCKENNIEFCKLIGETSLSERELAVKKFQEKDGPLLFFISLKAGGVGLTLTKASYVLFLDPWWNPFAEEQGIGRAHRIGQENKVNVVRFITKNTVEEKIVKLQESKKILSESLLSDDYISNDVEKHLDFILT